MAVSGEDGLVYSESERRPTNSKRFLPYIRRLSEEMDGQAFALFMDNRNVHKTPKAMRLYE